MREPGIPEVQGLDAGPFHVDSTRLHEEAGAMGLVLLFMILLRLSLKLVGKL